MHSQCYRQCACVHMQVYGVCVCVSVCMQRSLMSLWLQSTKGYMNEFFHSDLSQTLTLPSPSRSLPLLPFFTQFKFMTHSTFTSWGKIISPTLVIFCIIINLYVHLCDKWLWDRLQLQSIYYADISVRVGILHYAALYDSMIKCSY